ncbi:hypothetical protein KW790_02320 [Candidatus Parcubacteria bacterium]|nr:hypothetical protein [Candidatus Parcubacteria bacterium]
MLSTLKVTPAIPALSEAEAVKLIVPETVPPVGEVIETVGGVVSVTTLEIVTVIDEVFTLLEESLAVAERV